MKESIVLSFDRRTGGVLTWLLSAAICLFLCSCAEGGGTGEVVAVDKDDIGEWIYDTPVAGVPGSEVVEPTPVCGDGIVNQNNEQCDGDDLNLASCVMLGEGWGELACKPDCTYDLSMCGGQGGEGGGYGI